MKASKSTKIAILLIVMFITVYPTFLALATTQLLIWFFFNQKPFTMEASGYYFLPIVYMCAIAFFVSLVMLIKTIRSKTAKT
jgi:hypothetical protein